MSFLTKYGSLQGYPVVQTGQVFFVAPAASYTVSGRTFIASDDNDGLSPERAVLTIERAIALATASVGDVIVLLEGTHTVTSSIDVSKAGLTFYGVGAFNNRFNVWAPKTIVASTGTSTNLWNITADDCEIGYVALRPTSGYAAVVTTGTTAVDGIYVHDCYFDMVTPAVSVGTCGIDLSTRASATTAPNDHDAKGFTGGATVYATAYIQSNVFVADGAQGPAVWLASCYAHVKDNIFKNSAGGTWASPFVIATAAREITVEHNVWIAAGTMDLAIDGTYTVGGASHAVTIFNNVFQQNFSIATAASAIRGFPAAVAKLGNNLVLDENATQVFAPRNVG